VTVKMRSETDTDTDWIRRGACRDGAADGIDFFAESVKASKPARDFCALSGCPVKGACFRYARQTRQAYGVWGGVLFTEQSDRKHRAAELRAQK
jgi:hypothetical protein